jgi:peptidoglycan/LPS O-acetylase OafA/YrhL
VISNVSRQNNFDLLRLFASLQVVLYHSIFHFKIADAKSFVHIINFFPGVLMFFTISGFLIFSSFLRNKEIKKYFFNRFIRIYPALFLAFIITVILLLLFHIIDARKIFSFGFLKWTIAQLTIFQFWTPNFLRPWGVHTPNGSLWTIPVEIQFYVFLPLAFYFLAKVNLGLKFIVLFLISLLFNSYLLSILTIDGKSMFYKISHSSLFPYLYCFLIGSLLNKYWYKVRLFFEGKALFWFALFMGYNLLFNVKPAYFVNGYEIGSNILLSCLTISIAFTRTEISNILKGNDISYGVYIYHMLVVNTILSMGYIGNIYCLFATLAITIILGIISWNFVEKRFLNLKKFSN